MKKIIVLLALTLVHGLFAEQRTIKDILGRQLDVKLLSVNEDSVFVETPHGQEFDIPLARLSQEDQKFLSMWTPPKPETPENPIDSVVIMRSKGGEKKGYGTGFFAHDKGKTYIYTNQHVISDILNIEAVDSRGKLVELGPLEISKSHDLARFRVKKHSALLIVDSVENGEEVTALGNSSGAGVITSEIGKINGIGSTELEVSCEIVPGNSGGPVINSDGSVIGVVTYLKRAPPPDWVKKDTRYAEVRRFTIRPSRIDDWRVIKQDDYSRQRRILDSVRAKLDQAIWTFEMLTEDGIGYLSTLPTNWERDILQILRNHNDRQGRPDSVKTTYYVDGFYSGSTSKSYKEKKEASRRANLRALDRYLEDEFGDMYRLRHNYLDVAYFIENKYSGANLLYKWLTALRKDIQKEIEFSKSRY